VRDRIFIASKTMGRDPAKMRADLETTLRNLKTDHVDLLQFHNHTPGDEQIAEMRKFIAEGKVLHMGITQHKLEEAFKAVRSGLFETLQFPFSCLSGEKDVALVKETADAGMGFICMKAMSGGLIRNVEANFAFIRSLETPVPIWGVQRIEEIEQFLELEEKDPAFTEEYAARVAEEKQALGGKFCRGCGYCLPCPADIEIFMAARMREFMLRSPYQGMVTKEAREKMFRIENCIACKACETRCPYGLKPYELLKEQLIWYKGFLREKGIMES